MPNFMGQNVQAGPYGADQMEIQRRQRLAQMLQQQSMEPIQAPQGGAFAAPISPLQVAAKLYGGYQAGQIGKQAEEKQKALAERMQSERQVALSRALQQAGGSPQPPPELGGGPAMPGDPMGAAGTLAGSQDPMLAQAGLGMMGQQMGAQIPQRPPNPQEMAFRQREAEATREFRASESAEARASREQMATEAREQRSFDSAAQRAQRMQELTMRLSDQRLAAADRAALQRELAMMRADQQRSEAELKRASSPQAIKEREKQEGKSSLGSLLDDLQSDYESYQKLGADIDPRRSGVGNVINRVAASGVGQLVGGAVGTKEQEIRDSINQKRASLMAALKQATGMGATQLNSNVELQFYLRMATDPTMARSANKKAIEWLRNTYGMKAAGGNAAPAGGGAAPAGGDGWSIRPIP